MIEGGAAHSATDLSDIWGYCRADGSVGVRNHVLVLGINGLALRVSEKIAHAVAGAVWVGTPSGRGQVEPDHSSHLDQLVGLGRNPNVAGVLVVGVDEATTRLVAQRIGATGKPVETVSFAETHEDMLAVLDAGIRRLAALTRRVSLARRERVPMSCLTVAVECGHSDATSGLVSNPVVGALVDRLIDGGATVLVGETVEWLGAEHLLARRARDGSLGDKIVQAVQRRENIAIAAGRSLTGNNPGEENIRGGLSTIEEKSLGAVIKSGSRPVDGLLAVAEPAPRPGLYLMDGPYFSPESLTGFVASGAQIVLFTTGPGNSYASAVVPTIKITANRDTARRLREQIDFDASRSLFGDETIAVAGDRLMTTLSDIASGTLTYGEILGEGLEALTRLRGSL